MNPISKKLRDLENNVLELPEDDNIRLYIEDNAEMALHERAHNIKELYKTEVRELMFNPNLTFEQIEANAQEMLKKIPKKELHIINESHKFMQYRLMCLVYQFYVDQFPKMFDLEVWERIVWFFGQMDDLKVAKAIEESEWEHNRNEDDPEFDDFKWWDDLEAKIRGYYPDGVFTKESYEAVERFFDEEQSELIRNYWKAHPEENKEYMEQINKKLESLKNRARKR
jgi:hypothetical protein